MRDEIDERSWIFARASFARSAMYEARQSSESRVASYHASEAPVRAPLASADRLASFLALQRAAYPYG